MSKIEIDGVEYEAVPQVAGLLQAVSEERDEMFDHLEMAWVLIANANGGNWDLASGEWRTSAEKWRDRYHEFLRQARAVMAARLWRR